MDIPLGRALPARHEYGGHFPAPPLTPPTVDFPGRCVLALNAGLTRPVVTGLANHTLQLDTVRAAKRAGHAAIEAARRG